MPAFAEAFATMESSAPAPAVIEAPSAVTWAHGRPARRITTPSTPPSRTITLEPTPSTVTGTAGSRALRKAARSSASAGMNRASAAPPTRNQV